MKNIYVTQSYLIGNMAESALGSPLLVASNSHPDGRAWHNVGKGLLEVHVSEAYAGQARWSLQAGWRRVLSSW